MGHRASERASETNAPVGRTVCIAGHTPTT